MPSQTDTKTLDKRYDGHPKSGNAELKYRLRSQMIETDRKLNVGEETVKLEEKASLKKHFRNNEHDDTCNVIIQNV